MTASPQDHLFILDIQSPSVRLTSTNIWTTFSARSRGVSTSTLSVPSRFWARLSLSTHLSYLVYGIRSGSSHHQSHGSKKSSASSNRSSAPTSLPHLGAFFVHPRNKVDLVLLILVPKPSLSNFDMFRICCLISLALAAK